MFEILGYIGALLVGISLGLIGGGGTILTVPIMVYLLGINPVLSTAYSLFIVGAGALVGAINNLRKGLVSIKTTIVFAIPSFMAVYATRAYLIPAIPQELFTLSDFTLTKDIAIMIFFAVIMVVAAVSMIRSKRGSEEETAKPQAFNYPMIILDGLLVGTLTGIVGAGGGFLIIPALVLLAKLPMKMAVGTSLSIITIKSLIGFVGDLQAGQEIDWPFLLIFSGLTIVGILVGGYLSNFIPGKKLKSGFGWFVLVMATYILMKELVL